ncbi:MAG: hypothetical protein WC304_01765 [Candidatus Gracilibacteria bacterium]|jgi:hypothetical protein
MDTNTNPATSNFTPLPEEAKGIPLANTGVKHIVITKEDIEKFGIPEDFLQSKPALIEMILQTESMKEDEKRYWFQLLPIMSDEQIQKLEGILQNEKDQLEALDAKYANEISNLNDKHLSQWKAEEATKKRKEIEAKEAATESGEDAQAANILNQINETK